MKKGFLSNLKSKALVATGAVISGAPVFAADTNATDLSSALPSTVVDKGIWVAAGLVIGAVVAVKGIQIVMRLIKRV